MGLGLGLGTGIHYQGDTLSRGAALFWDFEHMGSLPTELAFTRGTAAMAWDDSLVLASYATNVPALARAIPSGRRGLVMQGGRTNLLVQSVLPGGGDPPTGWTRFAGGGTVAAATSIYGTDSAAYTFTSAAARPFIYQSVSLAANTTYTVSCEVEATTGAIVQDAITIASAPAGLAVTGYTINGVAVSAGATLTTGKLAVTFGGTYSAGAALVWMGCGVVTGNVTATVTLSRPQLEAATLPSLYIPTTTDSAPRSADFCTHTLSAALAAALSTQGTMVVEYSLLGANSATGGGRYIIDITSANGSNRHLVYHSAASLYSQTRVNGSNVSSSYGGTIAANATAKIGYSFDGSNVLLGIKGNVAAPVASVSPGSIANVVLGDGQGGGASLFGVIHKVWIYTHAMTDAELQAVTV